MKKKIRKQDSADASAPDLDPKRKTKRRNRRKFKNQYDHRKASGSHDDELDDLSYDDFMTR